MNVKLTFAFFIALTCLAPAIFCAAASSTQSAGIVGDGEDSRHLQRPRTTDADIIASASLGGVSIANDNRILHDTDTRRMMPEDPEKIIPGFIDSPPCKDSPLEILLETTGGSKIRGACKSMLLSKHTSCSESGVLASHCPKACGMCLLYKCSDSEGTFLMRNGRDRDCSWLVGKNPKKKRIECKKPSVAKTCRATCKFCPSDDTVTNEPSTELSAVPSAVPSFSPSTELSAVPSAVPSNKPSLLSTNAPSVQLSNRPSRELSLVPSFDPSYSPRPSALMWSQLYKDLTGETSGDEFGHACAISTDGSRLIAGALYHAGNTGQVRVYRDTGDNWELVHAPLNGDESGVMFGHAVGLSEDGLWIIVSALNKVKVFNDNGASWVQVGQDLIGFGYGAFRQAVGMSSKGSRIFFGGMDNNNTGRVHVFDYDGTIRGYVYQTVLSGGTRGSGFGQAVAISADGLRIIIAAPYANYTGGQTKVFEDTGSSWLQLGQDLNGSDYGVSVAMAGNGERVVIGTPGHKENGNIWVGQVKVFEYNSQKKWVHVHGRNFNGNGAGDWLGKSVGISHDGTKIVMGSDKKDWFDNSVQVFKDNGIAWVQVGADINGEVGWSTGITGDGSRIVASAVHGNRSTGKVQVFEK